MSSSAATVASLAARTGGTIVRGVRSVVKPSASRPAGALRSSSGWLVTTINCEPSEIQPTSLPEPLAKFGDGIDVRVVPAAGGKGVELGVRLQRGSHSSGTAVSRLTGKDPQADLRSALRRAKQLIEVGEVLVVDPVPHGERTATIGGALLEGWTKAAPKGGVR